ncbi:hypothetical protein ACFX13_007770 [Malus domestica]
MQTRRDGTEWDGTRRDGMEGKQRCHWMETMRKKKETEVIILCSMDVERVVLGDEAERKFIKNSSHGTTRSTHFRRTIRGTERLVPLRYVSSHVPNGT